jgi:septal ring factor EnvC (AmiA/AmiB activator)
MKCRDCNQTVQRAHIGVHLCRQAHQRIVGAKNDEILRLKGALNCRPVSTDASSQESQELKANVNNLTELISKLKLDLDKAREELEKIKNESSKSYKLRLIKDAREFLHQGNDIEILNCH